MTPLREASDLLRNTRASSCLRSPEMSGEQRRIALKENPSSGSSYYSLLLKNNKPPIIHNLPNPLLLHPQHTCMWKHTCSKERTSPLATRCHHHRPASTPAKLHLQDLLPKERKRTGCSSVCSPSWALTPSGRVAAQEHRSKSIQHPHLNRLP